jgi:hypothetical protein
MNKHILLHNLMHKSSISKAHIGSQSAKHTSAVALRTSIFCRQTPKLLQKIRFLQVVRHGVTLISQSMPPEPRRHPRPTSDVTHQNNNSTPIKKQSTD